MSLVEQSNQLTIDDLLAIADERSVELVDGELVEVHVSSLSAKVATRLCTFLDLYCLEHHLGEAFGSDAYYQCFPDQPRHARKPDASFVSAQRLPADWREQGYFSIAPDLTVEVLSPGDLAYEVDRKIAEYLKAGVRLVWEINPAERCVFVHRLDGTVSKLGAADQLNGEDVVPGFTCRVRDIFP